MARVKTGIVRRRRHNKILRAAKGFVGGRRTLFRSAAETLLRAGAYQYRDRRNRKREFRRLWNARINAAARQQGLNYSRLMSGLHKAGVMLNRKMLAQMAMDDPAAFAAVTETARQALGA